MVQEKGLGHFLKFNFGHGHLVIRSSLNQKRIYSKNNISTLCPR